MWDGFDLPGEVAAHQLPAPLDETVGDRPAALVGNSFGGLVALEFAARRPELVTKLVLLDAPLPATSSPRSSRRTRGRRSG